MRIADQQTDVARSAGLAGLLQALAASVVETSTEPYDRALYAKRRLAAARDAPAPDEVQALASLVEPAARSLGGWELVEPLLDGRPEAECQLAVGLPRVAVDIAERSLAWPA